jgi:hypothetical protein
VPATSAQREVQDEQLWVFRRSVEEFCPNRVKNFFPLGPSFIQGREVSVRRPSSLGVVVAGVDDDR